MFPTFSQRLSPSPRLPGAPRATGLASLPGWCYRVPWGSLRCRWRRSGRWEPQRTWGCEKTGGCQRFLSKKSQVFFLRKLMISGDFLGKNRRFLGIILEKLWISEDFAVEKPMISGKNWGFLVHLQQIQDQLKVFLIAQVKYQPWHPGKHGTHNVAPCGCVCSIKIYIHIYIYILTIMNRSYI